MRRCVVFMCGCCMFFLHFIISFVFFVFWYQFIWFSLYIMKFRRLYLDSRFFLNFSLISFFSYFFFNLVFSRVLLLPFLSVAVCPVIVLESLFLFLLLLFYWWWFWLPSRPFVSSAMFSRRIVLILLSKIEMANYKKKSWQRKKFRQRNKEKQHLRPSLSTLVCVWQYNFRRVYDQSSTRSENSWHVVHCTYLNWHSIMLIIVLFLLFLFSVS